MKGRRFHLIIFAMLLLSSAVGGLMQSPAMLQWVWLRVAAASHGVVSVQQIDGVLAGPIRVQGLAIHLPRSEITVNDATLDWYPGRLLVGRLAVTELSADEVVVAIHPAPAGAPPPASGFTGLAAPLASAIGELSLGRLVLRLEGGSDLVFDSIAVSGASWQGESLWVDALRFGSPWGELSARGRIATRLDGPLALHSKVVLSPTLFDTPLLFEGEIDGTLRQPHLLQRLSGGVNGRLDGRLTLAGGPLQWQASADLEPFSLQQLRRGWRPLRVGGHLQGQGDFRRNELAGELTLADKTLGSWRGEVELLQERRHLTVRRALLRGEGHAAQLEGSGSVALAAAPDYLADADFALRWKDLVWPVAGRDARLRSAEGSATLRGDLTRYRLITELALAAPGYPDTRWQLDAEGDLHHLTSRSLQLQGLGGQVQGDAAITWRPQFEWHAQLRGSGLDPGLQWPQWPGRLDIDVASDGVWDAARAFHVEVRALRGELRGHRFAGSGRLDHRAGAWQLSGLQLSSGSARLAAAGSIAEPWGVQWQLDAPQLAHLLPEARGKLQLRGSIEGAMRAPRVVVSGSAADLRWQQWQLRRATLDGDIDLGGTTPWRLRLGGDDIARAGQPLADTLTLQGDGSAEAHTLALAVARSDGRLTLGIDGGYREGAWQGAMHDGQWLATEGGGWQQAAPAAVALAAGGATLAPFCWHSDEARGCVAWQPAAAGGSELTASLRGLPLALFSRWLPRQDIRLGGSLVADAQLRFDNGLQHLSVDAHVANGTLRYLHPLDRSIDLQFKTLAATLHSGGGDSRALLDIALGNGDALHLEGQLPGWVVGAPLRPTQAVSGAATLSMRDLDWLAMVVPEILEPKGVVSAQLALGGTVAAPRLTGTLALADGAVAIPRAGLSIRQLGVAASSPDGVSLHLSGAARSGPGWVTLEGDVLGESLDKWRTELLLRGERFEALRLPSVHLLASPEVRVVIEPRRLELDGRLAVPEADIHLPELPTTVRRSSDVVLVEGDVAETSAPRWKINSRLTLTLGDYIRLEGYGFKGRVAGELTITERPDEAATGQGELTVPEGRYKAYGQDLTVEYGRLLFAHSTLDNPALDIRASRARDEVKVGVNITGRMQRPELRLFSEPPMEESDALAYLVLGRPLRTASSSEATAVSAAATSIGLVGGERIAQAIGSEFGIDEVSVGSEYTQDAALLLGKYLSPRLYVQYAVVFSDALNVTRLRYELTNHWYLKAESGEQQAADILYTFER